MALFDKAFNKFADYSTKLNRGVNKVIGKDVFPDMKKIEEPKTFPPYESFPEFPVPAPEQWPVLTGEERTFSLDGNTLFVSSTLDACMQYRVYFRTSAKYYAERFKFKYEKCVQDFDSLLYYFSDMYLDGLREIVARAYSLFLPFGIFNVDIESFSKKHVETYKKAVDSYTTMADIEQSKNQAANNLGNQIGGAVQMQDGGFGFKGAMKGMAQAEAFNLGMGLLGKYVASQNKMTQEDKAKVFAEFRQDIFFQEVYSDYFNVFFSWIQTLADQGVLSGTTIKISKEFNMILINLKNPMFPQDKFAETLIRLISDNPFIPECFDLLQQKYGQTEEVQKIIDYFTEGKKG